MEPTLRPSDTTNLIDEETGRAHLSHTALSMLLSCQRKYQLRYREGLELISKPQPLSVGRAFQMAIEQQDASAAAVALRGERKAFTQAEQDALEIDCAIVTSAAGAYLRRWPAQPDEIREYGYRVQLRDPWTGRYSEHYDLLGYADGLYPIPVGAGSWGLVENKLVAQITQVSIDRLPLDRQLALECYGVWRATGAPVTHVDYRFVRKPSIKPKAKESLAEFCRRVESDYQDRPDFYLHEERFTRSASDLLRVEAELWTWAAQLDDADKRGFWPRQTSMCAEYGRCPYLPICSDKPSAINLYARKEGYPKCQP